MAGGNFSQLTSPTEDEVMITLNQQLLAVSYLHNMGITHRDIKPENILVQQRRPNLVTKLSDFGLSSETAQLVSVCGTETYYAPEVNKLYRKSKLKGTNASYTNKVDVWSLGIFGLQYTIGLPQQPKPRRHSRWIQLIVFRVSNYRGQLGSLLTEMLQTDPNKRPSANGCLSKFPLRSPSFPNAAQTSKRSRYHLSTIQEDPLAKIPSSVQERKRSRFEEPESCTQPEHQILDLFGSQWLRTGRTDVSGDGRVATVTAELSRAVKGEGEPGTRDPEDGWDRERQEIVRQLLCSTQEEADKEVGQSVQKDSDSTQFRFSGFR